MHKHGFVSSTNGFMSLRKCVLDFLLDHIPTFITNFYICPQPKRNLPCMYVASMLVAIPYEKKKNGTPNIEPWSEAS